jgi:hypothetical protein
MTRLLFLGLLIATFSCKTENNKTEKITQELKVFKQFNYRITIDIWNGFFGHESKFILNNSQIDSYDSTDSPIDLAKPLTLYYVSFQSHQDNKNNQTLVAVDTTEIQFSKNLSDTLFVLTTDFLKNFDFNNYETIGRLIPVITDDSHGMVELSYGGRKLSATISSINNPTIGTKELDTLLYFVKKFRPTKKD